MEDDFKRLGRKKILSLSLEKEEEESLWLLDHFLEKRAKVIVPTEIESNLFRIPLKDLKKIL